MSKTKKDIRRSEEHSSLSSYTSSSSDEEIDARDLKPIKEYLSNRKELARQLFKSVKSDKIRMMLPQVLKQIDLNELEQWCVSELNGMSKTRIISILNDKPMLESSDTSESDDSGPSLEIISDTEEWLTDDDTCKKEDDGKKKLKRNKIKIKGKSQVNKASDIDKSNVKGKVIGKNDNDDKINDIKIKKEDSKDKDKEGDSLLDLLELEMRARAIRALIRKEEDIIPSANSSQANNNQTTSNDTKTLQDDAIAKEDCRKQLERIINAKQGNIGEDEDVVLVVQPTPVVELLSSESDGEGHKGTRVSQKLKNKRVMETEESAGKFNEDPKNSQLPQNSKEKKETQEVTASQNNTDTTTRADLNTRSETKTKMSERNVDIKNNILSISISADSVADKRKKSKRKLRSKSQLASSTCSITQDSSKFKRIKNIVAEQPTDVRDENIKEQSRISPTSDLSKVTVEEENSAKKKTAEESKVEKERAADSDEIIDLDDYCDVMDMDNCDDDKSQDNIVVSCQQDKQSVSQAVPSASTSESSETWASRYYQTDDVQNVIKESKIQSEIRKRLRERQRLSKLNKLPNTSPSSQTPTSQIAGVSEKTPTGSVEEYLALKRATNANVSASNNDSNNDTSNNDSNNATSNNDSNNATNNNDSNNATGNNDSDNATGNNDSNNATGNNDSNNATGNNDRNDAVTQDSSATVNSDNNMNAKEDSMQNESIPSHPECTNSTDIVMQTNCPPSCLSTETVVAETTEKTSDETNDNQSV